MTIPDYKSTIRLPQTDFPMKGNLAQKEPEFLKRWSSQQIYQKLLQKNSGRTVFTLPDGPPYANGSIHIGHALNKILKDIIIKYKNMSGFQSTFIPGWDCHGLPIEHKVMKELTDKKITKTDTEILKLCREDAQKWIDHQSVQFQRLGVLADWTHPYKTMSSEYESEIIREFARAFEKNVIYRGEKPVYWNWTLKTALADAEVEYHMHRSPSIYVKFKVDDATTLKKMKTAEPVSVVIWTTTPWTLPANLGICFHPDFDYGIYKSSAGRLVLGKALKDSFEKEAGLALEEVSSFKGIDIEFGKAQHPWLNRESLLILGPHVTADAGTGCVHTAPGHGVDDYRVGHLKYQLPVLCPVGEDGTYTAEVPEWKGLHIFKANPLIVEKLKQVDALLGYKEIEHSYPHCWRSKTPLIYRATPQWFLGIDLENSHLRQKTMSEIENIQFFPGWGKARFQAMMENRPDWCLSRQRIWGVPIPILYCVKTGEPLTDHTVMMNIAAVVEKGGIESFYQTPANDYLGTNKNTIIQKHSHVDGFGSEGFKHGKDILDVWFDSGVYHAAVQKRQKNYQFPADIYLEGSDQHRGWFNTSMLTSMATNGKTPFKALLTHGFVTDPQGRKMSKSLGNVIDPNEVCQKSGAEILRLWSAYEDYGQDISCGPEELARVTETYRRIRNTMRFLLGALADFNPQTEMVPESKMPSLEKWALHELYQLHQKIQTAYETYEFHKVYHALNHFFTVTLSATYLDILKDRLYTWKADGLPRKSSQTVLYLMTDYLIRMMAPILSFLSEECYDYFKGDKKESVFLLEFPKPPASWNQPELAETYSKLLQVRSDVQKVLETLRADKTIGASLEASVTISAQNALLQNLRAYPDLREFLIVSKVHVQEGDYKVTASKAPGDKCVRCWTYSESISKTDPFPEVCPKCIEALR